MVTYLSIALSPGPPNFAPTAGARVPKGCPMRNTPQNSESLPKARRICQAQLTMFLQKRVIHRPGDHCQQDILKTCTSRIWRPSKVPADLEVQDKCRTHLKKMARAFGIRAMVQWPQNNRLQFIRVYIYVHIYIYIYTYVCTTKIIIIC